MSIELDSVQHVWDADVQAIVERIKAADAPATMRAIGVDAARARLEAIERPKGPEMAAIIDTIAPGPQGDIPIRIYRPFAAPETDAPAMVWYHGGGMVMGTLKSFDRLARDLAELTGAVLFNVDYRLAPEFRYPAGNDDAYAALEYVFRTATDWGVDAKRIGVGGDSAGGGLAVATALRSRDEGGPPISQLVMFYPGIERSTDRPSMREFGDSVFLRVEDIDWMKGLYLGDDPDTDDTYGVPANAASLAGLPPTIIAVGYGDPIRDGVEAFGDRIRASGVPTIQMRYPGVGHGFAMQAPSVRRAMLALHEVGALVATRFRWAAQAQ